MHFKSSFKIKKLYQFSFFWINIFLLLNSPPSFASVKKDNLDFDTETQIVNKRLNSILRVIISTDPSFSIENVDDEKKIKLFNNKVVEFNQILQEKGKFSDHICQLSENKKWSEILKLTQNQDYIVPPEYLKENFLTQQYFNYTHAVSEAYFKLAKKVDILISEQYYHQIIKTCSQFLENIKVFQPDNDKDHICISLINSMINADLANAYYRLFMTFIGPEVSEELTCYLWKAASGYKKAITSYTSLRQFDQKEFEHLKGFNEVRKKVTDNYKPQLFLCYIGLITQHISDNLTIGLFEKAREVLSELNHTPQIYSFCKKNLEIIEKEFQAQTLAQGKGRIGPAVREKLINKLRKEAAILNAKSLNDEMTLSDTHFLALFKQFLLLRGEPIEALAIWKQIEDQTAEKLNQQNEKNENTEENLKNIYKHITNLKPIKFSIDEIVFCFLSNNDVKGALIRAEIFQELGQENESSENSMKVWIAYLKSLQGDYQEWLEIENTLDQIKLKKKNNRKSKQAKKHEKHVHRIQQNIKEKQKEVEQFELKLREAKQKQFEIKKISTQLHQNSSIESQKNDSFVDEGISNQQRHAEKNQRHQERLKQKEENLKENSEKEISKTDEFPQEKLDSIEKSSSAVVAQENTIDISSLLTGLALKVDQEIENDTWKFTKDQLQYYFEILGCIAQSGKGSHTKISFPKMIHIMYENQFITLIGEEGGALTLPRWEDKVPSYLRKQISLAREKIFQLKQKL